MKNYREYRDMKNYIVRRAIKRSILHNEIVTIPAEDYSTDIIEELLITCEDSDLTRNGTIAEFWGARGDEGTWRVHVECPVDPPMGRD